MKNVPFLELLQIQIIKGVLKTILDVYQIKEKIIFSSWCMVVMECFVQIIKRVLKTILEFYQIKEKNNVFHHDVWLLWNVFLVLNLMLKNSDCQMVN